ncbi:MAG: NUDIX domain-containing protein [bacterium]|nr:NUDIX domain-containing protein [bacterium]
MIIGVIACCRRLDDHRILLIKRKDFGYWSIPGGMVELGESLEAAIKREVVEETSVVLTNCEYYGTYIKTLPLMKDLTHAFHCKTDHYAAVTSDETIEVGWFDEETAMRMVPVFIAEMISDSRTKHYSARIQNRYPLWLIFRFLKYRILKNIMNP